MLLPKMLVQALASGYILMYFSEFVFYGGLHDFGTPKPSLPDLLTLYVAYSCMGYILLTILRVFRVRTWTGIFLAGAAYGWLLEGAVVATVYQELPFSLSFTGLAWHAPLDVLIGWYGLQKLLREKSPAGLVRWCIGLGILWGLWVQRIWFDFGTPLPLVQFARFSVISTLILILAYWVSARTGTGGFIPSRWVIIPLAALLVLTFTFNSATVYPVSVVILPTLLGLAFWGLYENRQTTLTGSVLQELEGTPPWKNLTAILLFPASAVGTYGLCLLTGLRLPWHWLFYILSTALGFGLFTYSLWKVVSKRPIAVTGQ